MYISFFLLAWSLRHLNWWLLRVLPLEKGILTYTPQCAIIKSYEPWILWFSGLSTSLWTEGLLVWSPVRAPAWVLGHVPIVECPWGNHTLMFLSLSFSLPYPLSKNEYRIFWTIRCTFFSQNLGGKWGCVLQSECSLPGSLLDFCFKGYYGGRTKMEA